MALPMLACAWCETHNYYLYSVYDSNEFSDRVEDICTNNWKAYLGMDDDTWFSFGSRKDEIIKAAQQKGDALMVSYVQNLSKYLDCAQQVMWEQWDYPTKEKLAQRNQTLRTIRSYAFGKTRSRLRSQHALLYMRCNMLLGEHAENVTFWEQNVTQFIESVYKDMMKNIYAGALYKTGKADEAGQLFAEMGDYKSLMTLYYKKRSFTAIRQEYLRDPNSAVLPFVLQDFVNNAQEAYDATNPDAGGLDGKLFIRNIQKSEALQMRQFCEQVVKEGKTTTPSMWKAAKAWLEYMFGNKQQALTDITEAGIMKGTQRMEDNTRILRIYISGILTPKSKDFDNWLEIELRWLHDKGGGDNRFSYYGNAYNRIIHQSLARRYERENRPEVATALYKSGEYYAYLNTVDTMKVDNLLRYKAYLDSPAQNGLDKFLKQTINNHKGEDSQQSLIDLIATKYMRLCQWEEAIKWLNQVPVSFYNNQGYSAFAVYRSYAIEPWVKRQWISDDKVYGENKPTLKTNPKLIFAKEMLSMESELNVLSGQARLQRYYDLAIRYAQANFTGDCWWLMRDFKSVTDTLRVNEVSLAQRALSYLEKASESKDFSLKEKALFGLCYGELQPTRWYESVWNEETYEYDHIPNPQGAQYRAFATLADFEKKNASRTSSYVSRCDEYIQFRKQYR